jgi:hypothetical protein
MQTSIHVEQRPDAPSKVQSGTFPVIFDVYNANSLHMQIDPLLARFNSSPHLTFAETRPTADQLSSYQHQAIAHILSILYKYVPSMPPYPNMLEREFLPRRPLPKTLVTKIFPLRASTIEEASIAGNLLVHDNVYIDQLQMPRTPSSPLLTRAIPLYGDLLTLARVRGCQVVREGDTNRYNDRRVFQCGMGLFHLQLNLIRAVLHSHRGIQAQPSSLNHFFAIMDKARLGGDKPDYYTLHAALDQILDGIVLQAWRIEGGFKTLEDFAVSQPSQERLRTKAAIILQDYLSPMETPIASDGSDEDSGDERADPIHDPEHQNIRCLASILLKIRELDTAIPTGDFTRIEDMFPDLARIFRGAGSNNYSTELLHLMHNLKHAWTPEFAYAVYISLIRVL